MTALNSDSASRFQCSMCPATFARRDHLFRHEIKHTHIKQGTCEFCQAQFQRKDILRRHFLSCKKRGDQPIPEKQKRGRRKCACDRCATLKSACDRQRPCNTCQNGGVVCTWNRVQEEAELMRTKEAPPIDVQGSSEPSPGGSASPLSPQDRQREADVWALEDPAAGAGASSPESLTHSTQSGDHPTIALFEKMSVPFLVNFVSADSRSMADTFGYSNAAPEAPSKAIESPSPSLFQTTGSTPASPLLYGTDPCAIPIDDTTWSTSINGNLQAQNYTGAGHDISGFDMHFQDTQMLALPDSFQTTAWQGTHCTFPLGGMYRDASGRISDISSLIPMQNSSMPSNTASNVLTEYNLRKTVMQLTQTSACLPLGHSGSAENANLHYAMDLFTMPNAKVFVQTYFHHFYPHCPIIHRAMFERRTPSLPLLLVICLTGAMYSSMHDTIMMARNLLDLAEECIFRNPDFDAISKARGPEDLVKNSIVYEQAIQAALSIVILQNYEGSAAARQRVRRHRLSDIVSSARALRLMDTRNEFFSQPFLPTDEFFDWDGFVANESRIRLCMYIFFTDNEFSIFHNLTPRIDLSEMQADLPCSEQTFAAATSADCYQSACQEKRPQPTSLANLVKALLRDEWNDTSINRLEGLTTLNFFAVLSALHTVIWAARANMLHTICLDASDRALARWKSLWDKHEKGMTSQHSKKLGFMKYAADYWWLAKLFIHTIRQAEDMVQEDSRVQRRPSEDHQMRYISSLISRFRL